MDLKTQLENALRDAMRSGNETAKRALRLAISSIKLEQVNRGSQLDDATIISILQKEIKMRQESIAEAEKGSRTEIVNTNREEIGILEVFLPKQFSEDELQQLVVQTIHEVNASSPADMSKVMKALLPKIQGRAPNDAVSRMVRQQLTQ